MTFAFDGKTEVTYLHSCECTWCAVFSIISVRNLSTVSLLSSWRDVCIQPPVHALPEHRHPDGADIIAALMQWRCLICMCAAVFSEWFSIKVKVEKNWFHSPTLTTLPTVTMWIICYLCMVDITTARISTFKYILKFSYFLVFMSGICTCTVVYVNTQLIYSTLWKFCFFKKVICAHAWADFHSCHYNVD